MKNVKDVLLHIFFPARCAGCGEFTKYDEFLCPDCLANLPFTGSDASEIPEDCKLSLFASPFYYKESVSEAVKNLKFNGIRRNARFLAHYAADCVKNSPEYINADMIIPVPLHKKDKRRRGYNQSELLGKYAGKELGIPQRTDILIKKKRTKKQHELSREERLVNVNGAFDVSCKSALSGKRVILIDDVFTTGSTMTACAEALIKGGAREVYGLTASRTPFEKK